MPTKRELQKRLQAIADLIEEPFYHKWPMLASTLRLLINIQEVLGEKPCEGTDILDKEEELITKELDHVILSCDASTKKNPGGPSSVAFVIREPGKKPQAIARPSPATSSNQAEYDAIYEALTTYFNLINNPGCKVEVRSDSKLAVYQLNGDMKCRDKDLERKRDLILELVKALPVPIEFIWLPRNSTTDLATANFKCQALLNVKRH